MSIRELVFLGTASQVPTRARNHNSMFLLWDDLGILFDPGESTQRQMTLAGISASRITHIAITHFHGDHCLGLAGVIQRLSLDAAPHAVEVFFPESGKVYFDRLRHASIFHDGATIVAKPIQRSKAGMIELFRKDTMRLMAAPLEHNVDCFGYRLEEDDARSMVPELLARHNLKGPVVGQLAREGVVRTAEGDVHLADVSVVRPGQSMALVMDTRPCPGAKELAKGATLLVCESTYLNSEAAEAGERFHMTAEQAATLARDCHADTLALTHFSSRYTRMDDFKKEAQAVFANVVVADDLARVRIPRR